jgi:uncharacterized membrane protein
MENEQQNQTPTPAPQPVVGGQKPDSLLVVGTYFLFFLPLVIEKIKKDEFFHFHMKQSLGLLIAFCLAGVVQMVVWPIGMILQLGVLVLWVLSWLPALNGKQELTPILGEYFKKINI